MTEAFSYTYQDLIDSTVTLMARHYKNIDSYSAELNIGTKVYFTQSYDFTIVSKATPQGKITEKTNTVNSTLTAQTTAKNPALVTSDAIKSHLQGKTTTLCDCALTDTVTAKGMLAYLSYVTWMVKNGTTVVQYNPEATTGAPCFAIPTGKTYNGLTNEADDAGKILKGDFESIVLTLSAEAFVSPNLEENNVTYPLSVSSCCSSCSSSSSSSSCSSSSSSSCSSSIFIAYMKII